MSEVKGNIRLELDEVWVKVGAARCAKREQGELVEG